MATSSDNEREGLISSVVEANTMSHARRVLVTLLFMTLGCLAAFSQTAATVTHFVAPPFPREAKDQRIMGTTVSRISVTREGTVESVTMVHAHPVFETAVNDALRQWRFQPTSDGFKLEVKMSFEFYDEDCKKPLTPETKVVADLPHSVTVRTGLQCVQVQSTQKSTR